MSKILPMPSEISHLAATRIGGVRPSAVRPISLATLIVIALFTVLMQFMFHDRVSGDLLGFWAAGEAISHGMPQAVYPPDQALFSLVPPVEWAAWLSQDGVTNVPNPYVYPPLWAWVASKLNLVTGFAGFERVMAAILPVLMGVGLVSVHRLAAPRLPQALFVAVGLVILTLSTIGSLALYQSQLQVVVAFLVVLAIERSEAGKPRLAGALMALAAALKIFPVFFAILWLIMRRGREVASFVVVGAGLAGLSVALTGWPLHQAFLHMLGLIGKTAMLMHVNYAFAGVIAQFALVPDLVPVVAYDPAVSGYLVVAMQPWLAVTTKVAMLLAVGVSGGLLARSKTVAERAALWPFALVLINLCAPLSWAHYYIAAASFLPMLLDRLQPGVAMALIVVIVGLLMPDLPLGGLFPVWLPEPRQLVGTAVMLGLAVLFVAVRHRPSLCGLPGSGSV